MTGTLRNLLDSSDLDLIFKISIFITYNVGWWGICFSENKFLVLGPVVQSVVSLTSSLRVISLTVLADSMYNILIFFAEKM